MQISSRPNEGLSVVVCTYERYSTLGQTIECLLVQALQGIPAFEIIVVDNSPDQKSAVAFARRYDGVEQLRYLIADRPGLSNARNIGLEAARYSAVAYVDDDVLISSGWGSAIYGALMKSGEGIVGVGGKVILRLPAARPKWLHDRFLGYLGRLDLGPLMRPFKSGESVVGCNMCFARLALIGIGGFDRALGRVGGTGNLLSNEELQITVRLREQGKEIVYAPDAILEHIVDSARLRKDWFRERIVWQARSDLRLGGPHLKMRRTRAKLRRLIWPALLLLVGVACKRDSEWQFLVELEALYDENLLRGESHPSGHFDSWPNVE